MDFDSLTNQLYAPKPAKRIESLRILGMLEETRAINAIALVYKNDPDEGVRQAAKWAGSLIWNAQQRGHNTLADMQRHFDAGRGAEEHVQDLLLRKMRMEIGHHQDADDDFETQRGQREILDSLQQASAQPFMAAKGSTQVLDTLAARLIDDESNQPDTPNSLDLLDAGLQELD